MLSKAFSLDKQCNQNFPRIPRGTHPPSHGGLRLILIHNVIVNPTESSNNGHNLTSKGLGGVQTPAEDAVGTRFNTC